MMQKSNEEIYKALSEAERNLAEKNVGWMDKASKRKENHAAIGKASGEVVFYDGEYVSTLEGLQVFVFKDGTQPTIGKLKMELRVFGFCAVRKTINLGKSSSVLLSEEMYQLSLVMPRILNRRLTMSF